jgi:hypothetical protein
MSKRTDKLTKDNFTLLNIVEFMEANGFHVREAREIEREHIYPPFGNLGTHPAQETFAPVQKQEPEIEAIRLEIAPKTED